MVFVYYESVLDIANKYNLPKALTRYLKRHVDPFRHLLVLRIY